MLWEKEKLWKWWKVLQKGRKNAVGKGEIACNTAFSKDLYCRHLKTRACLGKG